MILSKREQDRLVSQHYDYARKRAAIFCRSYAWLDRDDLSQEAMIAMMDAASVFDPDKGATFVTWCTPFIRFRFLDYARAQGRAVARADRMAQYETEQHAASPEETLDRRLLDEKLEKYPHLSRYLMGHTTVDLGAAEAVFPSTIWRRLEKEAGALAAELGSNNASAPRKMMGTRGE